MENREFWVNMGPQHPSTHGVLRLLLALDGEMVVSVEPVIGYLHRCAEKIGENLPYSQYIPFTDRFDYVASMSNNLGYSMAVEELMEIEVPERAQFLRIIIVELQRIASHLVAFGSFGLDMGAFTPLLYAFREREYILDIFEKVCGARLTYSYIRIGGTAWDFPDGLVDEIKRFCDYFEPRIDEYDRLLSFNKIFLNRTVNVAILPKDLALDLGVTGPNLRGSGVDWDLRHNEPYSIYNRIEFQTAVGSGERGIIGDAWNRYIVRIKEMRESVKIVRQALALLPEGSFMAKVPRKLKPKDGKEVMVRVENPKGELGFYLLSDGSEKPYRLKVRAPSFANVRAVQDIGKGLMIADLVAALGSLDIVLGEIDR